MDGLSRAVIVEVVLFLMDQ